MLIPERVDRLLGEQLGGYREWTPDTRLFDHNGLDLDSLDAVELLVRLEQEFGIEPDFEFSFNPDARVRDVVDYVEGRITRSALLFTS